MASSREVCLTGKDKARAVIDRLPDDCSLEEVVYHLYVVQQVDMGMADAEAGRTITHEDLSAELRRKWLTGATG